MSPFSPVFRTAETVRIALKFALLKLPCLLHLVYFYEVVEIQFIRYCMKPFGMPVTMCVINYKFFVLFYFFFE